MRVIFACTHNAGRSQMAAAFFNKMVDCNIAEAISAGTQPAEYVHPEVVIAMKEIGFDLGNAKPKLLTDEMINQANLLITMGCSENCPYVSQLKREDWLLPDPRGKTLDEVRKIRDNIKDKVQQLIATFKQVFPIKGVAGIELIPTDQRGVSKVVVSDPSEKMSLSWDRFIRLNETAKVLKKIANKNSKILDVGGYDGASALFLPDYQIDLIDPVTTGSSLLNSSVDDSSYDIVIAIDVLEHINPIERKRALNKLSKVARLFIVLNYPHQNTKAAQELILKATNNVLIREHVEWELPDTEWVLKTMQEFGFIGNAESYGNLAVWLGQYLTLNLVPNVVQDLNRYLVENHSNDPFSTPLYELLVCRRMSNEI